MVFGSIASEIIKVKNNRVQRVLGDSWMNTVTGGEIGWHGLIIIFLN